MHGMRAEAIVQLQYRKTVFQGTDMQTGNQIAACLELAQPCVTPTVSVVDGELGVCQMLRELIESAGWHARTFASAAEYLQRPPLLSPNCLLLEVQLPDISGLDLQARMSDRPETPIIFITSYGDVSMSVRAMKAGAFEFFTKPLHHEPLMSAIRHAVRLSADVQRRESQMSILRNRYDSLTSREREVLGLVVRGYLNKQVGSELGISEITVKAHRGKLMRKMAAASLPQLVGMASNLDLLYFGAI
jgi:FixJ family two-component response regulator